MNYTLRWLILTFAFGMMFATGYRLVNSIYTYYIPDKTEVWICIQDSAQPPETCSILLRKQNE